MILLSVKQYSVRPARRLSVKAPAAHADDPSSTPGAHTLKGETQLSKVVL